MKALKYFFFLVLIVVIVLAVYISVQPSEYDFQKTRVINAPAPVVFNYVNDYRSWEPWNPWEEADPTIVTSYPENTSGVNGYYEWTSSDGNGKMETVSVTPHSAILQKLSFEDFEPSDVYWNFEETPEGTKTTWGMKGTKNFMFKMFTTFAGSMEETVGPMYERGLEKLDSVIKVDMGKYNIEANGVTEYGGGYYIYVSGSSKLDEIGKEVQKLMPKVGAFAQENNITYRGAPFILYHEWDEKNNAAVFSCGIPTADRVITPADSDILTGEMPAFTAFKTTLTGNYVYLKDAWSAAMAHVTENELIEDVDGPYLEVYANDPMLEPNPAKWITEIYIPLKPKE